MAVRGRVKGSRVWVGRTVADDDGVDQGCEEGVLAISRVVVEEGGGVVVADGRVFWPLGNDSADGGNGQACYDGAHGESVTERDGRVVIFKSCLVSRLSMVRKGGATCFMVELPPRGRSLDRQAKHTLPWKSWTTRDSISGLWDSSAYCKGYPNHPSTACA